MRKGGAIKHSEAGKEEPVMACDEEIFGPEDEEPEEEETEDEGDDTPDLWEDLTDLSVW